MSLGRSFRFFKEISLELYVRDDLKIYMEARSTSNMKRVGTVKTFDDR